MSPGDTSKQRQVQLDSTAASLPYSPHQHCTDMQHALAANKYGEHSCRGIFATHLALGGGSWLISLFRARMFSAHNSRPCDVMHGSRGHVKACSGRSKQGQHRSGSPGASGPTMTPNLFPHSNCCNTRTRLQVGVHQLQLVHECHALQQLPRKRLGLPTRWRRQGQSGWLWLAAAARHRCALQQLPVARLGLQTRACAAKRACRKRAPAAAIGFARLHSRCSKLRPRRQVPQPTMASGKGR